MICSVQNGMSYVLVFIIVILCNICLIAIYGNPLLIQLTEKSDLSFKSTEKCFFLRSSSVPYEFNFLFRNGSALKCDDVQFDWVVCEKAVCFVKDIILIEEKNVRCTFIEAILSYSGIKDGPSMSDVVRYVLVTSDVVRVYCKSEANTWSSILVGFRDYTDKTNFSTFLNSPRNVLILGFASVSTNTFIYKLPLTYKYLTKVLQGDVVRGYNVVEDAYGISSLNPFITGISADYIYGNPYIWEKFKRKGFMTAYLEDSALWDFLDDKPTNQFNQPHHCITQYYLLTKGKIRSWQPFCSGSVPRHRIWMNYIQNFFTAYGHKKKFLFSFQGEFSHFDYNKLDVIDEDLLNILQMLQNRKLLDDTLLIIMSDKSYKFTSISNTIGMKREELSPFLYFRLPTEFMKLHPVYYKNFQENIKKLITPYDVHATLEHILQPTQVKKSNFAISLFNHIPQERSCPEAQIHLGSCGCMVRKEVNLSSHARQITMLLESTLNNITQPLRDVCATAMLSITNLMQIIPNSDLSGYIMESDLFIATAIANSSYTLYEAYLLYNKNTSEFSVDPNDIVVFNNEFQTKCAENDTTIRKFCNCKN